MSEKSNFEQFCDERGVNPKVVIALICSIVSFMLSLITLVIILAVKKSKQNSKQVNNEEDSEETRDTTEIEENAENLLNDRYFFDKTSFIPIIPKSKEQESNQSQSQQITDKTMEINKINESFEKLIKDSTQQQQENFDEKTKGLLDEINNLKSTITNLQNSNKPDDEKFEELSNSIMSNTKKIVEDAMQQVPKDESQSKNNELFETINNRLSGLEQSMNDIKNKKEETQIKEDKPVAPNYMSRENEISIEGKPQNIKTSENQIQINSQEPKPKYSNISNNSTYYSNGKSSNNILSQSASQFEIIDKPKPKYSNLPNNSTHYSNGKSSNNILSQSASQFEIIDKPKPKYSNISNNSTHYSNGKSSKQRASQFEIIGNNNKSSADNKSTNGNINVTTNVGGQEQQQQNKNAGGTNGQTGTDGKGGNISNTVYVGGQPFYGTPGFMNCYQPAIQPYYCGCNYFPGYGYYVSGQGCYKPHDDTFKYQNLSDNKEPSLYKTLSKTKEISGLVFKGKPKKTDFIVNRPIVETITSSKEDNKDNRIDVNVVTKTREDTSQYDGKNKYPYSINSNENIFFLRNSPSKQVSYSLDTDNRRIIDQ